MQISVTTAAQLSSEQPQLTQSARLVGEMGILSAAAFSEQLSKQALDNSSEG